MSALALLAALLWPSVIAGGLVVAYRIGFAVLDAYRMEVLHSGRLAGLESRYAEVDTRLTYECAELRKRLAELEERIKSESSFRTFASATRGR